MSRPGRPAQLQNASRTVRRSVSAGSPTANRGSRSTRRVSQERRPSSTSVAASMVVIDFVTEPIIIRVSGVTGWVPPNCLDTEAVEVDDVPARDDRHRGAGNPEPGQRVGDVGLERGAALAGQRQRLGIGQVELRRLWLLCCVGGQSGDQRQKQKEAERRRHGALPTKA